MRIRGTHGFDFLRQFTLVVGGVALSAIALDGLAPVGTAFDHFARTIGAGDVSGALVFIGSLGVIALAFWALSQTVLAPWVATYLHILFSIRLGLSAEEAHRITFCFDGSLNGKWLKVPKQLRILRRDVRKTLLFALCNRVAKEHRLDAPFPELAAAMEGLEKQHRNEAQRQQADAPLSASAAHAAIVAQSLQVLGITGPIEDFDQVRRAWKAQMQRYHPDRWAQAPALERRKAEEQAKALNAAYGYLENAYGRHSEGGH